MGWIKDKGLQLFMLVLLIGTLLWQRDQIGLLKAEQKRIGSNLNQVLTAQETGASVVQVKLDELENYLDKRTDSIIAVMGIKPKWIKEIAHITNNYYNNDTTIVETTQSNIPGVYNWRDTTDKCFTVGGFVKVMEKDVDVGLTEKAYNAQVDYVLVGKPEVKILGIRFRKGELYLKVSSDCGTSTVNKIDVVK